MKSLWIGIAEVLTEPSEPSGDTRAFTNVVTWAEDVASYGRMVESVFSNYGWTLIGTENVREVNDTASYAEDIAEIIAKAKNNPNACMFSTFHYYPSLPS